MHLAEVFEERQYAALNKDILGAIRMPLLELYDLMFQATAGLTRITAQVIVEHPSILKIMRYVSPPPTISQMRLGQIIGMGTTSEFEERGRVPTPAQAERLAAWLNLHLDHERFPWLTSASPKLLPEQRETAEKYARLWTVALLANQNVATRYRTQRKELQEAAIASALTTAGLESQSRLVLAPGIRRQGGIADLSNLHPNHFVRETKIRSGRSQKADVIARVADQLVCIEAKAVGIRLDSSKRIKELNDKKVDWDRSPFPITTVGVFSGFFNAAELVATIRERRIPVFWEHDLARLAEFIIQGTYYGAPWKPETMFQDVSEAEIQEALVVIDTATASNDDSQEATP